MGDQSASLRQAAARLWCAATSDHALVWGGIAITALGVVALWVWPQAPGFAVALLGFVAILMAVAGELTRLQRVSFVVLAGALLFLEIRSISRDRAEQEAKFSAAQAQNQAEFNTTLRQLSTTASIITGGTSFPFIVPQVHRPIILKRGNKQSVGIPMLVWNSGPYPLSGVSIHIAAKPGDNWLAGREDPKTDFVFPVIAPRSYEPIRDLFIPKVDSRTGTAVSDATMTAANGFYLELIYFRKRPECSFFGYRLLVQRLDVAPNKTGSRRSKALVQPAKWSDDVKGGC